MNRALAHTQGPVRPFIGANRTTSLRPHDSINRAMVVASSGQPALQLGNRRSIAVSVSCGPVVTIIVPVRRIIPVRIIFVVKGVRNAPSPRGVPTPVVRINKTVPVRRIIPIRIIAEAKRVRNAPAPSGVPTPVVRITQSTEDEWTTGESIMPRIAAPITAAPFAVFYRFASAEFRPASAQFLSASQRPRAKMFALFAMISAVSAVSALFAMSALFRQSSASGEGKGEDDRKERFHSTKYSILTARVRLSGNRREVTARIADSSSKRD